MARKLFLLIFLTAALALAKGPVSELRTYTGADGKLVLKIDRVRLDPAEFSALK